MLRTNRKNQTMSSMIGAVAAISLIVGFTAATNAYPTNWYINIGEASEGTVCYAYAHPQTSTNTSSVNYNATAYIKLLVTSPVRTEFSTQTNLDLTAADDVELVINNKSYKLKTLKNVAWLKSTEDETEVVLRMLASKEFDIIATTKGSSIQFTYKLDGLKQALREIQAKCRIAA